MRLVGNAQHHQRFYACTVAQIGKCLGIRLAKGFLIHKAAINGVGIFSLARIFAGDYNRVVEKLYYLIICLLYTSDAADEL